MIGNVEKYFKTTFTVKRLSKGSDSIGNPIKVWATIGSVDGTIKELSNAEKKVGQKESEISSHRLYTTIADIQRGDQIVQDTHIFDVVGVNNVMNMNRLLQVEMIYRD